MATTPRKSSSTATSAGKNGTAATARRKPAAAAKPAARKPVARKVSAKPRPAPVRTAHSASMAALGTLALATLGAAAFGAWRLLRRPSEGVVPTDLMGDEHPDGSERAIPAFRPDPTAPVPASEREQFRPALLAGEVNS